MHIIALTAYYFMWAFYEIWFTVYIYDDSSEGDTIVLAVSTLIYNISSIIVSLLLFHMILGMTQHVTDDYFDPVLKRHVPFFVYIAN